MKRQRKSWIYLGLFFIVGCGGSIKAPQTPDGSQVTIYLLADRGITDSMTQQEKDERNELGAWLEQDMSRQLTAGGYNVSKVDSKEAFTPGKGKFLLTHKIERYVPGRLTSREEAGFGEGVVELDTYIELYQENVTLPVLQKKQSNVSARPWQYSAKQVNNEAAPAVSKRINELY